MDDLMAQGHADGRIAVGKGVGRGIIIAYIRSL
jgi:hypothetical protein